LASFRAHGESVSARSLAQREYRVNVLDGLAMLHEAVFNPAYEPLRAVAKEMSIDLGRGLQSKALWAYGIASRAARDPVNPDPSLLRQWNEVAHHFIGLRSIPPSYRSQRRWQWIVNRYRALAGSNEAKN
jgi:hypothetical protein